MRGPVITKQQQQLYFTLNCFCVNCEKSNEEMSLFLLQHMNINKGLVHVEMSFSLMSNEEQLNHVWNK